MSLQKSLRHIYVVLFFIGFLSIEVNAQEKTRLEISENFSSDTNKKIDVSELVGPPNGQSGWVIVEPMNILPSSSREKINLIPYKYRRQRWGSSFSVAYSMFAPTNFESHLGALYFSDIYNDNAESPMIELQYNIKRNFFLGSISIELGIGYYSNDSDSELVDSSLEIIPIRLGINYMADAIFSNPYIAPYIGGGAYIFKYAEKQDSTTFNGTTQASPYATFGLQISLNWIDSISSSIAYIDSGIEDTSVFVEARKYFSSSDEADPDFETNWDGQAGLRLEF